MFFRWDLSRVSRAVAGSNSEIALGQNILNAFMVVK